MTPEDSANDRELLERYKRASDLAPAAPSDAVRAAILAEGRRVAEERAKSVSRQPFDVSRRAANDSRWKITAFGTAGAALVAALLFAPRLWENARGPAQTNTATVATSNVPSAPPATSPELPAPVAAPALQAQSGSLKPLQQDRQASLAESAPAENSQAGNSQAGNSEADKKYARAPAAAAASTAKSTAAAAPPAGYASDVSGNRAPSARAKAAEPSGLLAAASSGDTLEIVTLTSHGAAVNERDELGRTPLMLAVIDGRPDAVRLLLDRGADPNAADHSGRTPLQMARQANLREIVALLQRSGAR